MSLWLRMLRQQVVWDMCVWIHRLSVWRWLKLQGPILRWLHHRTYAGGMQLGCDMKEESMSETGSALTMMSTAAGACMGDNCHGLLKGFDGTIEVGQGTH